MSLFLPDTLYSPVRGLRPRTGSVPLDLFPPRPRDDDDTDYSTETTDVEADITLGEDDTTADGDGDGDGDGDDAGAAIPSPPVPKRPRLRGGGCTDLFSLNDGLFSAVDSASFVRSMPVYLHYPDTRSATVGVALADFALILDGLKADCTLAGDLVRGDLGDEDLRAYCVTKLLDSMTRVLSASASDVASLCASMGGLDAGLEERMVSRLGEGGAALGVPCLRSVRAYYLDPGTAGVSAPRTPRVDAG